MIILFTSLLVFVTLSAGVFFGTQLIFTTPQQTELLRIEYFDASVPLAFAFLVLGIFISLLLSVVFYFLNRPTTSRTIKKNTKVDEIIKSRDFFLRLFEEAPLPYLMVAKDGNITLANKAALRLFKRTPDDLAQYKFYQLHSDEHFLETRQIVEKFERGVAVTAEEVEIVQESGTKRWVSLSILALNNKNGGGVVSLVDITEIKAIDKVKTEFVSLASHQLRTPLTAMKWFGEMVLESDEPLTPKQRKYIEKIYKGNERMIDLVNSLLSASRLELGSLAIDIQKVDPVVISQDLLEEHAPQIHEKHLHIIERYKGDNNNFYTDKRLVHMILQNLISNAIKYTRENGEVRINLSFTNENLHLQVTDTGLGIPSNDQSKIFSKMFRAQNARAEVTDGNGLGLYIVREAVLTLNGTIEFESEENVGTSFTIVLPNGTHGSLKED